MKILYYYQYFGTPAGSWSSRVYELTRRWVREGHQVTVITSPYEKSDIRAEGFITRMEVEGVKLIVINSPDSNRQGVVRRAFNALRYSLVSVWYALSLPYDIAIASSGPITIAIPALIAKWLRAKRFIFEIRDLWPQGGVELGKLNNKVLVKMAFAFEAMCYQQSAFVVTCSPGMSLSINTRFPAIKTIVIPNAADVNLFSAQGFIPFTAYDKEVKYFIYAGSLGLMDDAAQFVAAMKYVKRDDIRLIIIGAGAEKEKLQALSADYGDRVSFLGLLPKNEVVGYLKNAYAAIVSFVDKPVIQTSSPNKLFDALAAGVPVIQNTTGWIKELIEEENCGINVAQNCPECFAKAFDHLAAKPEIRNTMAKNAYDLALKKFNIESESVIYLNEILKVCK